MVYSADVIPGAEALAVQKRVAALLSYKLKQEYSEMCGLVRAMMSLVIVRSNILLLRGPRDKGVHIRQRPDLTDGAVMSLLVHWHVYLSRGARQEGREGKKSGTQKR